MLGKFSIFLLMDIYTSGPSDQATECETKGKKQETIGSWKVVVDHKRQRRDGGEKCSNGAQQETRLENGQCFITNESMPELTITMTVVTLSVNWVLKVANFSSDWHIPHSSSRSG